jgi:hypothetical protein
MTTPDLKPFYDSESEDIKGALEIDKKTNELYFNKKKLITDIKLDITEKWLAWCIALSTAVIAICSIINIIIHCGV